LANNDSLVLGRDVAETVRNATNYRVFRPRPLINAMDLYETIQDLYAEKERLERVIASLEALLGIGKPIVPQVRGAKRGRKSMSPSEREEVSARMKNYWDRRRKDPGKST
jgi:hypothetical protein